MKAGEDRSEGTVSGLGDKFLGLIDMSHEVVEQMELFRLIGCEGLSLGLGDPSGKSLSYLLNVLRPCALMRLVIPPNYFGLLGALQEKLFRVL